MSGSTLGVNQIGHSGSVFSMSPIGHVESVFKHKNGTPRQSGLCKDATAKIRINKNIFNNPEHALENIIEYSHVWVLWIFHQNSSEAVKAKVSPPRLKGGKVGLFSSRTPHRPNPIGLTLATVQKVVGDTLYITGIDMIEGTPVLDIKPFIPMYDNPRCQDTEILHLDEIGEVKNEDNEKEQPSGSVKTNRPVSTMNDMIEVKESTKCEEVFAPGWIGAPEDNLKVSFTSRCLRDLDSLDPRELSLLQHKHQLQSAIRDVLASDPRSVYRKDRCSDRLYYTTIDNIHVTAWFDPRYDLMEVLALRPEIKPPSS